jgi:hypothetical protein
MAKNKEKPGTIIERRGMFYLKIGKNKLLLGDDEIFVKEILGATKGKVMVKEKVYKRLYEIQKEGRL